MAIGTPEVATQSVRVKQKLPSNSVAVNGRAVVTTNAASLPGAATSSTKGKGSHEAV